MGDAEKITIEQQIQLLRIACDANDNRVRELAIIILLQHDRKLIVVDGKIQAAP